MTLSTSSLALPIVISQYEKIKLDIEIISKENGSISFDYKDKVQNHAARSYVFKMRKIRASVDAARKEAKAYSLEYGRRVDSSAADLVAQVDALILPHQEAIDAIETMEKVRIAKHQKIIDRIIFVGEGVKDLNVDELNHNLERLNTVDLSIMEEFIIPASNAMDATKQAIITALPIAKRREAEAAELLALRAEKEARDAADKIEAIKRQAVESERARAAAAQAAEDARAANLAAHAKAMEEARAAAHRAQAEAEAQAAKKAQAEALAQAAARVQAAEAEAARVIAQAKAQAEAAEAARMEEARANDHRAQVEAEALAADTKNRARVFALIVAALDGLTPLQCAAKILDGSVPNVFVRFEK